MTTGAGQRWSSGSSARPMDAPFSGKFIFQIDGVEIGRFMEVSGLSAEIDVQKIKEGGQNQYELVVPGRIMWQNLVLKRGITSDNNLFDWFTSASGEGFTGAGNKSPRRTGHLSLLKMNGDVARAWEFEGALPVKWTGPTMSASSTDIATEELEIAHNGIKAAN